MFEYYKRGKGELNTSNFPNIVASGHLLVETLDEKTFMSLMALNEYMKLRKPGAVIKVEVFGYVAHLRGDKDEYPPARLYELLDHMSIECQSIQHESTPVIKSATITKADVMRDLPEATAWFTQLIGADGSVPKFFPEVDGCAQKVRANGKVTEMDFPTPLPCSVKQIVIVDDLLGGGATIQMLVDIIRGSGFTGKIHMWVAYNEGFHKQEFLDQFDSYHIGVQV